MKNASHCEQIQYELVYRIFSREVMVYANGYLQPDGESNGHLIKVRNGGLTHYERVENHLQWK